MSSGETFIKQINSFFAGVEEKENKFLRQLSSALQLEIIKGTPVDTGFARANWFATISGATPGEPEMVSNPNYGGTTKSGMKDDRKEIPSVATMQAETQALSAVELSRAKIGDIVHLANNCEYIEALEYGHSQQAPEGMVRIAIAKADSIAVGIIAKLGAA